MEEVIKRFLSISSGYVSSDGYGSGYGSGDGSGHGYGSGYVSSEGYGSGYGDGDGAGSGYDSGAGYGYGYGYVSSDGYDSGAGYGYGSGYISSDGYGYGSGSGSGIKQYNGQNVYLIDNVQTIIDSVHGNYAKGKIINTDLTLTDCYVAKAGNFFAHGETLRKAMDDAIAKELANEPIEDKVKRVVEQYPDIDKPIEHRELYILHNLLTGSCELGRKQFATDHGLDPNNGTMTMREFINLTKDAYGRKSIKLLAESYGINL